MHTTKTPPIQHDTDVIGQLIDYATWANMVINQGVFIDDTTTSGDA